eukprot:4462199-Prymnesium_polylepis.1
MARSAGRSSGAPVRVTHSPGHVRVGFDARHADQLGRCQHARAPPQIRGSPGQRVRQVDVQHPLDDGDERAGGSLDLRRDGVVETGRVVLRDTLIDDLVRGTIIVAAFEVVALRLAAP